MTDFTTAHLQRLLWQSTPGPWRYSEDIADTLSGTQEIGHEVYAEEKCLFGVWNEPVMDEYPGNLKLAALAPDLACELIRQRREIRVLITAMEDKATTGQSQSPAIIAGYLKEIVLGDHDE